MGLFDGLFDMFWVFMIVLVGVLGVVICIGFVFYYVIFFFWRMKGKESCCVFKKKKNFDGNDVVFICKKRNLRVLGIWRNFFVKCRMWSINWKDLIIFWFLFWKKLEIF